MNQNTLPQNLIEKCENLILFINTNLYVEDLDGTCSYTFSKINIPRFLEPYTSKTVHRLSRESKVHSPTQDGIEKRSQNQVYLYKDPFKLCYLTWQLTTKVSQTYAITLGPILTERLTSDEVRFLGYKMKLGNDNCFILESFFSIVPFYDTIQLIRLSSLILDYLQTDSRLPQIIRYDDSAKLGLVQDESDIEIPDYDFVEQNYRMEEDLLHHIEIGDTDYMKVFAEQLTHPMLTLPARYPNDPLRENKNTSLTLNSLANRAAIKGGIDYHLAHNLSYNFGIRIEAQSSIDALLKLNSEMLLTYTESVRKYGQKNHSVICASAVSFILKHITKPISLRDIADALHISKEHVSRTFKEEMGMTLTDYIHKIKIQESLSLLESGRYNISNLSEIFGYTSPAHYTKMFKRVMGVPPIQFQKSQ